MTVPPAVDGRIIRIASSLTSVLTARLDLQSSVRSTLDLLLPLVEAFDGLSLGGDSASEGSHLLQYQGGVVHGLGGIDGLGVFGLSPANLGFLR